MKKALSIAALGSFLISLAGASTQALAQTTPPESDTQANSQNNKQPTNAREEMRKKREEERKKRQEARQQHSKAQNEKEPGTY